jgi:DNA-binding NtrC family response regulator
MRKAIDCIKAGAYDFITKPYEFEDLLLTLGRALEHKELLVKTEILTKEISKKGSENIIGNSSQLKRVLNLANKAAISDSNILIEGETGTGKELLAEYIHKHSARKDKPFVVINCASLPDQLIESELFGHERGAFTDAKNTKQGLVEIAHGGSLFLDEIGELSLALQPKLLRFLENGEYRRIGGITTLTSNVRVIGATNRNLLEEADNKNFRKDLLFRLNVITLTIPPLRDRKDDILLLANHFIKEKTPIRSPKHLSAQAEEILLAYSFNGNIRELDHIIERALIFAEGDIINPEDLNLPQSFQMQTKKFSEFEQVEEILSMEDLERWHIKKVLDKNRWDRTQTANQLGISPKTLYTKIKKYELRPV